MNQFKLGEDKLTFDIVREFLAHNIEVKITEEKREHLKKVRDFVENCVTSKETFYGINTGFGRLANEKIEEKDLEKLQTNLVRSHAFGVGEPLPIDQVRLMTLLRAHVIALGYSGASLEVVDHLIEMINHEVVPIVPCQGSVGASGDLSPLAHLALAMIGEGEVYFKEKTTSADIALKEIGLLPLKLKAKDGLTLINGTQAMTAIAAIAVLRAEHLVKYMDLVSALSIEGLRGSSSPFDEDVHRIRRQKGQSQVARQIQRLIFDSEIISEHINCGRVQDPYSLRCIPQVHGAARDAFIYAKDIIERELNACTDNPLVFIEAEKIVSGGNFHGEPIAIAMDTLGIAISELGAISERRVEQLTNPKSGDLPVMFLTPKPGLNSGFMIPHVVATSLASENKTLAHPASVDSMTTSAGQEDHVSMGMWATRKVHQIIDNVEWIGTTEAIAACQAIDLHENKLKPGKGTEIAYDFIRDHVKFLEEDRYMMPEVRKFHETLKEEKLVSEVEEKLGEWIL